jgi:beta-glucosidase
MSRIVTGSSLVWLLVGILGVGCAAAEEAPRLGESATEDVIAAMTLEEKVGLVMGLGMSFPGLPSQMQGPHVEHGPEAVPGAAGETFAIPRLGIPSIVLADGPAGLRIQPTRADEPGETYFCTAFPVATLLASSWDPELVERVGRAVGSELRAYGVDILLAPALNIHRNPLGGRNFEYYSEDPLIAGRMAAAMVRGVQSTGVGTSLKHYVANNHEWNRDVLDVLVGERALREIYLRGFEIAVKSSRPWTIMSSYNKVAGTYASESANLITGVLRDDWGFDGFVMTDWFGGRNPVAQMQAGNELLMPGTELQRQALLAAVRDGALSETVLDRNLEKILGVIVRTPSFLDSEPSAAPDLPAHAAVARQAATQGMVLLRNERALPLAAGVRLALLGNASFDGVTGGTGSGDVNEAYSISLGQGLAAAGLAVDEAVAAEYADYIAAEKAARPPMPIPMMLPPPIPEMPVPVETLERLARESDLALVTLGRNSGEFADRRLEDDFTLSAVEQQLLRETAEAFHARAKKVVVVLNIGGVIETVSWRDEADAILVAWQPGQEAGYAIADVLTGRTAPSGKLATTFPVRWEDVTSSANFPGKTILGPDPNDFRGPLASDREAEVTYEDGIFVGYRHFATHGVEPAYPFGFGLGYTTFGYGDLTLSSDDFDGSVTAMLTLSNTGDHPGREVVQLYVSAPGDGKPALELRDFAKSRTLAPGESQTFSFTLTGRDLASFDPEALAWVADAGTYTVKVGASSADIRQQATFSVPQRVQVETVSTPVGTG